MMRECVRSTSILVTIIVPVYNVESYIDECLKSLVSQTYRNIEIICVNDGSTDDGVSIVNKYKGEDERIILVNQQNSGVSVARNIGLSLARGEIVLFVDSDDYVDLDAVELIIESFSKDKPDLILFGYRDVVFAGGGEQKKLEHLPNEYFRRSDLTRVIVTCWSKAYSLEFLRKNSIKFKEGLFYEDLLFNWQCLVSAESVVKINRVLYSYRNIREGSIMDLSREKKKGMAIHHLYCLDEMFASLNLKDRDKRQIAQCLFEKIFKVGLNYINDDEKDEYVLHAKKIEEKYDIAPRICTYAYDAINGNAIRPIKYRWANSILKRFVKIKRLFDKSADFYPLN